eukprot:GGOE01004067.1.p1 GENE.GGOE01004067.1~~GGOE01004067.1.p1  ORF type:complete len:1256 (+),score=324.28 GGOE01004067.1:129-3896(+)
MSASATELRDKAVQDAEGPSEAVVPRLDLPPMKAKRLHIMLAPMEADGDTVRAERNRQDRRWIMDARDRLQWKLLDVARQASAGDGLLQLIPGTAVEDFRRYFRPSINRQQLHDMLGGVLVDVGKDPASLRSLTSLLFDAIDTNGSGWVTWEEFSSYLVFQYGESASLHLRSTDIPQLTPTGKPLDRGCIHTSQVRYVPELDKFTLVEGTRATSRNSGVYLASLEEHPSVVPLAEADGVDASHFLAAEYLPWAEVFVCSTTGHHHANLQFYALQHQELSDYRAVMVRRWHALEGHDLLRADADMCSVFASGRFGHLTIYKVPDIKEPTIVPNVVVQEQIHTAAITDFTFLTSLSAKRVATCGLDGLLRVQDVQQLCSHGHGAGHPTLQIHRHQQGVLTLVYSAERNLIFAAGFEREISAWCAIDVKDPLAFKLVSAESPHTDRIIHLEATGPNSIVSTDASGVIKVWDIRSAGLVQSLHIAGEQRDGGTKFQVLAQALDPGRGELHIVGRNLSEMSCQLFSFCKLSGGLDDTVAHDGSVSVAVYHPKSNVFITAAGDNLKVWDAATGHLQQDFPCFARSHITAVCYDGSGRKFFMGTHMGMLTVHSIATGAVTFEYQELPGEVLSICFLATVNHIVVACADHLVRLYNYEGTQPGAVITIKHSAGFNKLVYCRPLAMVAVVDDQESALIYMVRAVRIFDYKFTCCFSKEQAKSRYLSHNHNSRQLLSPTARVLALRRKQTPEVHAPSADLPAHAVETNTALHDYFSVKRSELICAAFAPPFAALVLGDTAGFLTAWQLWGDECNRPVLRWRMPTPNPTPVTPWAMDWLESRGHLCVGDELGRVSLWDVAQRLGQLQVPLVSAVELHDGAPEGSPLVHTVGSTKARGGAKRPEPPALLLLFQAHSVGISTLQVCQPPGCILTAASDGKVLLWNPSGESVGDLRHGNRCRGSSTACVSGDLPETAETWAFHHATEEPSACSTATEPKLAVDDLPRSPLDCIDPNASSLGGPQQPSFATPKSKPAVQAKIATPKAHLQVLPTQFQSNADPFDSDEEDEFEDEPALPSLKPKFRTPFASRAAVTCGGMLGSAGTGLPMEQLLWRRSRPHHPQKRPGSLADSANVNGNNNAGGIEPQLRAVLGKFDLPTPDDRKQLVTILRGTAPEGAANPTAAHDWSQEVVADSQHDASLLATPIRPTSQRPLSAPFSKGVPAPHRASHPHPCGAQRPESAPALPASCRRGVEEPLPIIRGKSLPTCRK